MLSSTVSDENLGAVPGTPTRGVGIVLVRSEGSLILMLSSTVSDENLGAVPGMPTRGVGIVLINLFTCFGFVLITKKWNNNKQLRLQQVGGIHRNDFMVENWN